MFPTEPVALATTQRFDLHDRMMGVWWGVGIFWWLFWLAIFVLVVVAIWRLVRGGGWPSAPRQETALDILKKRYAQGEIDREEFEAKKRDLGY